jgi:hypothetical protein
MRAFVLQYREWLCEHVSMVPTTDAANDKCVGIPCEVSIRGGVDPDVSTAESVDACQAESWTLIRRS